MSAIDEQIVYNQLDLDETAIWSLLLASGYLKVGKAVKNSRRILFVEKNIPTKNHKS